MIFRCLGYAADKMKHRSYPVPYAPDVSNPTFCSNFEEFDSAEIFIPKYLGNSNFKEF